jgi:hypothetical protein
MTIQIAEYLEVVSEKKHEQRQQESTENTEKKL